MISFDNNFDRIKSEEIVGYCKVFRPTRRYELSSDDRAPNELCSKYGVEVFGCIMAEPILGPTSGNYDESGNMYRQAQNTSGELRGVF